MRRKILFLVNPISGVNNKEQLLSVIEQKLQQQNIQHEILPTNSTGNYFFLKEKIDNEYITDIVICGGDGTVNQVANALIDTDVKVGVIPAGSGNGLAFAAGIPNQADKAMDIILNGKASYIDAFFINSNFSCMLCGLGFDALVAHEFSRQKKRGLTTYVKQVLIQLITAEPYYFEVTSMGKSFTTEAYFICIANSNQFGNHVTIAPQAKLNDGLLDVVIAQRMNKPEMILAVLKQIRSGKVKPHEEKYFYKKGVLYFQTDRLIINNLSMAPLHIDGEPAVTAKKFVIEVVPSAFKLIQP